LQLKALKCAKPTKGLAGGNKSNEAEEGEGKMHHESDQRAVRISIQGIVQGVGFRPFVYQLASRHNLKGWVCNTSRDVKIEAEGSADAVGEFLIRLKTEAPPRSRIDAMEHEDTKPAGYTTFEIRKSIREEGQYQLVSPDIATCEPCRTELFDPDDRRYGYPFINCTNCGPRLTIIKDIPYDRPMTTMAPFKMCPDCQREDDDPMNRRFHAQPNCCPRCGPHVEILDQGGNSIASGNPIVDSARFLTDGKIVAIKGIGGFLLACDATDEEAVKRLRHRKRRTFKPFAVMVQNLETARQVCSLSPEEADLIASPKAPIVLLRLRTSGIIAPSVAPNLRYLGLMLPYTPLHHLLMKEAGRPLVMTSGNLSEEPIVGDNDEALERLSAIADAFLVHNRDIYARCDDSVAMVEGGEVCLLRRARGYAPDPLSLHFKAREVLACGAEYKNTFCMTKDRYAFLSQHVGDMDNLETLSHFEKMLDLYKKLFRLNPRIVACDKHPDYLASRYAREVQEKDGSIHLVPVQHHHAHIVSCMVENAVTSPVLGVALDGTGYGDDGAIWGSEFLLADYHRFSRLAHFEYLPLPGGDGAVKRPYRIAVSYLYSLLGEEALNRDWSFLREIDPFEVRLLKDQIDKRINAPLTSSAGRLFDAVSALLGIRKEIDYEGQAAVELEMAGTGADLDGSHYFFRIDNQDGMRVVRLRDLFEGVISDLLSGVPKAVISVKFHHTLARVIGTVCRLLADDHRIKRVAVSGGVFQNRMLLNLTKTRLREEGLEVITHKHVPCNDGCISLGQAVVANFLVGAG
jgi:hydrogenase maturation protein HypF